MVKLVENIDDIWKVLKDAYGDPKVLLNCELDNVRKLGSLAKIKDHQELSMALSKLANAMENLKKTATTHNIEQELFNSHTEGLVYEIMGDQRVDRFLEKFDSKAGPSSEGDWKLIIDFLRDEARRKSRMALKLNTAANKGHKNDKDKPGSTSKSNYSGGDTSDQDESAKSSYLSESKGGCKVCGGSSCENKSEKEFEYVKCSKFREMKQGQKLAMLKKDKICFQCLKPNHPWKKECPNKEYGCQNEDHKKFNKAFHVVVCEDHKDDEANVKLLEEYKLKIFKKKANIPKNFVTNTPAVYKAEGKIPKETPATDKDDVEEKEHAIFMLQRIKVEKELLNLFFDGGCGDMVCSKDGTTRLSKCRGDRATEVIPGPTQLIGVSDTVIESEHGLWTLKLPMANGKNAVVTGLCLNKVTHTIPDYEFADAAQDIKEYCKKNDIELDTMPQFPTSAGGDTAVMMGMQYKKHFPKDLVELPNGLTFCESKFVSADGTRGVICGPHWSFTAIQRRGEVQYVMNAYNTFFNGTKLVASISLLGFKESNDPLQNKYVGDQSYYGRVTKCIELHEAAENAGTVCDYRCNDCRNCPNCKKGESIEKISLQTELHQVLIDKSVTVDIEKGVSVATLPIIEEHPEKILVPNGAECMKIFSSVAKQIRKDPECQEAVVEFEDKLQRMGFVEYVENLTPEQQKMLDESPIQNFIPWLIARNKNSVTTATRMVFNGSKEFKGKRCINSILAKGVNSMNPLLEIVLRFCIHAVAFHTDVQKMYNSVLLDPSHWCYQRYWWQVGLDLKNPIVEKIIRTVIYGMTPSGNQAERALRLTASLLEDKFPKAAAVIKKDTYVDDLLSGDRSMNEAKDLAEDVKVVLLHGGFKLKGITYSGEDPPENLTEDGKTVKTVGWKWWSMDDEIQLCVGDLAFEKIRKWKADVAELVIPENLTRTQCHSKVAQIFDLTGKVAPLVGGMKLDLRKLNKLDWKETIPEELRQVWVDNFEMIKEIGELKFQRCVIPEDAINLDIETLDFGDSSDSLICAAVYVRVRRVSGEYSCQLMFARTKLLPEGTTIPRGELAAAELCATTGHVVRRSLGKYSKGYCKFTDSQAALFWLNSRDKPLNQWVRGRVIEINRLSDCRRWSYIQSSDNVADIGTRKGAQIKDVDRDSVWNKGMDWMRQEEKDFPTMTVDEINFKNIKEVVNSEMHKYGKILEGMEMVMSEVDTSVYTSRVRYKVVPKVVNERYQFCNYVIDPNKFRLRKVVRIVAIMKRFIKNARNAVRRRKNLEEDKVEAQVRAKKVPLGLNDEEEGDAVVLEDAEVMSALDYFYKKSTEELKKFKKKKEYERISEEVDGILYYKGRILLEQSVTGVKDMCDVMIDLSCRTFWVPLVDRYSPFAYSIIKMKSIGIVKKLSILVLRRLSGTRCTMLIFLIQER